MLSLAATDAGESQYALMHVNQGQGLQVGDTELLHLVCQQPLVLEICAGSSTHSLSLPAGSSQLLACHNLKLTAASGAASFTRLDLGRVCKLMAFLDQTVAEIERPNRIDAHVALACPPACSQDMAVLEAWLIGQVLAGGQSVQAFSGFLRRMEHYWLVRYLLVESTQQKNISDMGEEYGLSYSHFRRICKLVLGNSLKSELQSWRAARSLLDVIIHRESMTKVALRNGYASSSHFSHEIKKRFGQSPTAMTASGTCVAS